MFTLLVRFVVQETKVYWECAWKGKTSAKVSRQCYKNQYLMGSVYNINC